MKVKILTRLRNRAARRSTACGSACNLKSATLAFKMNIDKRQVETKYQWVNLEQAQNDLRNFITSGAAAHAIQALEGGPKIAPDLLFNCDSTSMSLCDPKDPVLVTPKTIEVLDSQNKGVAVTKSDSKNRWGHFMPFVSASGVPLCFLAIVYDRKVEKTKIEKVSAKNMFNLSFYVAG